MSWYIVDDVPGSEIGYRGIVEADGTTVCNPSPMGSANARLIAAAPDLLAALQEMLKYAEGFEDADHVIDARAAIAKAIGESA